MHVVLVNPLIPQNTGSIARTCAATETPLHLIEPLGFELSERTVRRAGLDYWPYVKLFRYPNFAGFVRSASPTNIWCISKFGNRTYWEAPFGPNDALVFGSETTGLGKNFLAEFPTEQILQIPMTCKEVRSLNLSNAVSIVLYEALRQGAAR